MSLQALLEEMRQQIADLDRRLSNVVRPGRIVAVDPAGLVCRHQSGDLVTGWVRWLTHRAGADRDWWVPSVGEQAILFAPDGEPNQGWVLPAGYSNAFPAPESDPARHVVAYADGVRVVHEPGRLILDAWDAEGTVEIRAKNVIVKTGEGGFFHLDHFGKATRVTHKGGNRFETDSWTTGAVVIGNPDQGFTPPEIDA